MSRLDDALAAIRSAPLATLDDLNALLNAAHGRISSFNGEFDMASVMDRLADMEHALENVQPIDKQAIAADEADDQWIDEHREAA